MAYADKESLSVRDDAIYVFTRDRPEVLFASLNSISAWDTRKHIIDDSCEKVNQLANAQLASEFAGVLYVGNAEYQNFRASLNIEASDLHLLLRSLGKREWNLGYARNLALLLAKVNGVKRALFLDDDIEVPDILTIKDTFNALDEYDFVGARIEGMPDNSIVGHIANELGVIDVDERMLSGGFLAFNPSYIEVPFANIYNEDWIWQLLQPAIARRHELECCVFHRSSDPYSNIPRRIKFQEFGEIIVTGLMAHLVEIDANLFTDSLFWEKVLSARKDFLGKIRHAAIMQKHHEYVSIIALLLDGYDAYESQNFVTFFRQNKRTKEVLKDANLAS